MASAKVKVEHIESGVRAVLKSQAVEEMLAKQARSAAQRCIGLYGLNTQWRDPPYVGFGDQRGYTAVGVVTCATRLGRLDNLKNNTLRKGAGI